MSKIYVIRYGCRICLKLHELKADAESCCENEERVRPFYKCDECGTRYTEFSDVVKCCQEQDVSVKMQWSQVDFPEQEKFSK